MSHTVTVQKPVISDETRWDLLQQKALEFNTAKAVALLREGGFEPILIKGVAAAHWYPVSRPRLSIDIDLAVSAQEFDEALNLSTSALANGLAIDLHRELRHLDTVVWDDLFSHSEPMEVNDIEVRVLCPEDNLRILCVHWLTDGGTSKDRLWDIFYAVENRPADFSWDRFLKTVSGRRQRWLACTIGLADHFLGLDLSGTPLSDCAACLPEWLIKTVEREWASETRTWPLEASLSDPGMFFRQLRKRMRPNPIWATVQMEGSFDARTRLFYQAANLFKRIIPSYRRISDTLRLKQV